MTEKCSNTHITGSSHGTNNLKISDTCNRKSMIKTGKINELISDLTFQN